MTSSNMPNIQGEGVSNCIMNISRPQGLKSSSIPYGDKQPTEPNFWNGNILPISLFGTIEFLDINFKNISISLLCIADFICNRKLVENMEKNILFLSGFGKAAWSFISSIYKAR